MEYQQNEPTIESLVTEFNSYGKLATEHLIKRFRAVALAKAQGKNRFRDFCDTVKLDPKSSTTRKFAIIGAEADWLLPIAHHLPAEWTTLYDVVKLGKTRALEFIDVGMLHAQVTAKVLKSAIAEDMTAAAPEQPMSDDSMADETIGMKERCVFQVDASELANEDQLALYRALQTVAEEHGLMVTGLPDGVAESLIIDEEAA